MWFLRVSLPGQPLKLRGRKQPASTSGSERVHQQSAACPFAAVQTRMVPVPADQREGYKGQ